MSQSQNSSANQESPGQYLRDLGAKFRETGFDADEITLAGGMMGEAVNMVKCRTSDILVPADAEIIIEGECHPTERQDEGPFGEWTGYYGSSSRPEPIRGPRASRRGSASASSCGAN